MTHPIPTFIKPWWVYIVECADGTYYTGISPDINKRIEKHNSGNGAKYTKYREPVELVYFEKHENRSLATKREIEIKKLTHDQKRELSKSFL
jgi:putative endonuclease